MGKEKNPHWLIPIIKQKCPACHKGEFFLHRHGYRLKEMGNVHERCSECGQRFQPEPGFFFGATYISYAFNVIIFGGTALAVYLLIDEPETWHYIVPMLSLNFLLLPMMFRASRMIWATMFIPFGGEKKQGAQQ